MSVRWRSYSWMQFWSLFFFYRPWHGPTTDDRLDQFPDGWLSSNHSMYGVCECKDAISNTPKDKNHTLKDRERERERGPRHVSETGNEVPGKHVSNNGHWLFCRVRCGTILLKPHTGTVYSSSAQFWVLPIQKISGSCGSSCSSEAVEKLSMVRWVSNMFKLWDLQRSWPWLTSCLMRREIVYFWGGRYKIFWRNM